ncbi:MAG: NAD(P)/FAD-dependent oxidoreductase [Patescibacteria group bacterium]|nr:NAD(P)/FAD-dependent oxidoreductase [Patescibacteria group bacterium]
MARIIIIGAGHNGLVCADYLARAGHQVTVFEQSNFLGGAARSDSATFPGYTLSTYSYVCSLFLSKIVEDLGLARHGYEILERDPSFFKPLLDGRFLSLGKDGTENARQIAKFSEQDAEAFRRYGEAYGVLGGFFEQFLLETPPSMPPRNIRDVLTCLRAAGRTLRLGPCADARLLEIIVRDARAILADWFESDVIRSALLPDSSIGSLDTSGLLLILHQFMGAAGGARGMWGYHRGGMGGIAKALASAGREFGVEIVCNEPVKSILISKSGVAYGVWLKSGEVVPADIVVSNATPHETFLRLVSSEACPPAYARRVRNDDYSSGAMKVNAILSGLPEFNSLDGCGDPAHYLKGTIHLSPTTAYIERALSDVLIHGIPSELPMVEMTIPSIVDNMLAPQGHHVMNLFVQYVPDHPRRGGEWTAKRKDRYFRENILSVVRPFVRNIDDILIGAQVLSPQDMYRDLRLTGGNIFHGAFKIGLRHPYRTPIPELWLCGAGTHPGGGVMGACGHNAARDIAQSLV